MEKVKHWYLHNFLSCTNTSLEGLIKAVMEKGSACSFYADPVDHLSPSGLVEMMILDGCFIVELFWKKKVKDPSIKNDLILKTTYMFQHICRDLLLLEISCLVLFSNVSGTRAVMTKFPPSVYSCSPSSAQIPHSRIIASLI
ncbi:hypothetical protein ACFXTO_013167 [Malus domestica]